MTTILDIKRIESLAKYLECEIDEIEKCEYSENSFEHGRNEYLILTDDEADSMTKIEIEQSLWAFKPSFLLYYTPMPNNLSTKLDDAFCECLSALQEKLCEDANPIILALVKPNLDRLINDAIMADGRGHFLANYDSAENEQDEFYIYKQ